VIRLSVVVPVYNEEDNINDLYLSITEALSGRIESYEIWRPIPGIYSD
jgi:dolichol-phosphate mannosyltransferase